jgi:glycosyltransferase involved in cell wall biosynthesis
VNCKTPQNPSSLAQPATPRNEYTLLRSSGLHCKTFARSACWRGSFTDGKTCSHRSLHSSTCLLKSFGCTDVLVTRYGVDIEAFSPGVRTKRRDSERASLGVQATDFCLLMIGNDWKNKGLDTLLEALGNCREIGFTLVVVGSNDRRSYDEQIRRLSLESKILFPGSSPDVMRFYAAADTYVAPSLEDAYGLPILEAMACGLPVIASSRAGASEVILDGQNGLVLRDPEDSRELATLLRKIYSDLSLRTKIGTEAARTAKEHTWDRNAAATWEFLTAALAQKEQRQMK